MESGKVHRLAALRNLVKNLQKSVALLPLDSRAATIVSLLSVVRFLESIPETDMPKLHAPLSSLAIALQELDHGVINPILKPTPFPNGPPQSSNLKVMKGTSIFCIDVLMKAGLSNQGACQFIASKLLSIGVDVKGKQNAPAWRTVKNWRDGLSKIDPEDQLRHFVDGLRASQSVNPPSSLPRAYEYVTEKLTGMALAFPLE